MLALTSLLVFLTVLILECARRRRAHWQYFAKRNIPGPPPHFLWGHYLLLRSNHRYWFERWTKEYGDTYGVFWGRTPLLVTSDLDLQKRVLIKDFSNFVNRAPLFALERIHPMHKGMLMNEDGARWKELRSVITPAFSSGHMKAMTEIIFLGVKEFVGNIAKQGNRQFDLYPLLRRLTMDSICRTAFGVDANSQTNADQKTRVLVAASELFELTFSSTLDVLASCFESFHSLFGSLMFYLFKFNMVSHASDKLSVEARRIVDFRRKTPRRSDIMQTLLDSNVVNVDESSFTASGSGEEKTRSSESSMRKKTVKLSDDDVVANSVLMLMAGYETTSTGLAYTFHLLAKHPEIQEKLRQEIIDAIGENEDLDSLYMKAMNLKYLDLCIRESLRLYPPVTGFTSRMATKAIDHKDLRIDAGLGILFPTHIIQNDPRNFENPLSFIPDRFTEKTGHPLAYQAFGDGPRNCVGMRMALLSMKLAVCQVLRRFRLKTHEELEVTSLMLVSQPRRVLLTAEEINP